MEDYIIFLRKSKESLNTAKYCFETEYFNSCVNRAYYAMFQVAVAALFKSEIKPKSKKIGHNWVQAEFTRFFVWRKKRFPRLKGLLNMVQRTRDIADYSAQEINKKRAKRVLDKAVMFIETVSREVDDDS